MDDIVDRIQAAFLDRPPMSTVWQLLDAAGKQIEGLKAWQRARLEQHDMMQSDIERLKRERDEARAEAVRLRAYNEGLDKISAGLELALDALPATATNVLAEFVDDLTSQQRAYIADQIVRRTRAAVHEQSTHKEGG